MRAASLLLAPLAHADSTFYFTLNAYSGNAGAGSLTVNPPPSTTSGVTTYYTSPSTPGQDLLESINFFIDGDRFNLSSSPSNFAIVSFTGGSLSNVSFSGIVNGTGVQFLMTSALTYSCADSGKDELEVGTISTTVTPEPSGLVLLATGLVSSGIALRRRPS